MRKPKRYVIVVLCVGVIGWLIYAAAFQPRPDVAFVPLSQETLAKWRCEEKMKWTGNGWTIQECSQPEPATVSNDPHLVLFKDGRQFDLQNFQHPNRNGLMQSYFLVEGNTINFYAEQQKDPGCFHLDVYIHGRWHQFWTMQSIGDWHAIPCPKDKPLPTSPVRSGAYRMEASGYHFVRTINTESDLCTFLDTGDYYLAPPGAGWLQSIDLNAVH